MRYVITIIPFMDSVHIHVKGYGEELHLPTLTKETFTMEPEDGETEYLYSILSWLASEIAADAR
jgi:hypothetical protein